MSTVPETSTEAVETPPAPRVWFGITLLFLFVLAGLLHRVLRPGVPMLEFHIMFWSMAVLWAVLALESLLRLVKSIRRGEGKRAWLLFLLVLLFPPARLGILGENGQLWLPQLGWLTVNRELTKRLEKLFSIPMMVMALLSLPILVIEVFFAHWVEGNFALALVLDACMSLIWAMFTIEFVIMFSIAAKKWSYLVQHWIDLVIIVLPIVQALPFLRALRLGGLVRLEQVQRMNQLYRLRRVAAKLWRAFLLLDLLNRMIGRRGYPRRIRNLEEKLQLKLEELEEIRQQLLDLKEKQAAYEAEKAAKLITPLPETPKPAE